jgi:hypothetical protein
MYAFCSPIVHVHRYLSSRPYYSRSARGAMPKKSQRSHRAQTLSRQQASSGKSTIPPGFQSKVDEYWKNRPIAESTQCPTSPRRIPSADLTNCVNQWGLKRLMTNADRQDLPVPAVSLRDMQTFEGQNHTFDARRKAFLSLTHGSFQSSARPGSKTKDEDSQGSDAPTAGVMTPSKEKRDNFTQLSQAAAAPSWTRDSQR